MSKRGQLIAILVAVVAAVVGFAVAALVGVRATDPAVQGAVVGAVAGVGGGVLGAAIGAWGVLTVARMNSDEARRFRFSDRTRQLAVAIEDSVRRLAVQVRQQMEVRHRVANLTHERLPDIEGLDDLASAMLELDLVTNGRDAALAGRALARKASWLVRHYAARIPEDFTQDGHVHPLSPDLIQTWNADLDSLNQLLLVFSEAIRRDLGLDPIHSTSATVADDSATQD
jgi:hypothetical protein